MTIHCKTQSGVSPVEAGLGLVDADTLVVTTDDVITATDSFTLRVAERTTTGPMAELQLSPGRYDATITTSDETKKIELLVVDPRRIHRTFGARHGSLEYPLPVVTGPETKADWPSLWKTKDVADIVVDFPGPHKFVFWRGMSFAPSWMIDNVYTCNFFAETVEPGVYRDCCEMMGDRECRYIHARVVHNTPARVVVHWRYPLADPAYTICRDQWVDEMYHIYPDGVVVRSVTIHLDPNDEAVWCTCPTTGRRVPGNMFGRPKADRSFNDMEFITVNPPGATSDDVTPLAAMTLLDGGDYRQDFTWPKPPNFSQEPLPELGEYIFRMNYKHRPGVFIATGSEGLNVGLQANDGMRYVAADRIEDDRWEIVPDLPSNFSDHIHWPVTRGYGTTPLTDKSQYADRPTHTFLGFANNAPVEVTDNGAVTWAWLSGIAPEDESQLRRRVKAWTSPPVIPGAMYSLSQGAYVVDEGITKLDIPETLTRPTFALPQIPAIQVSVNGLSVPKNEIAVGIEHTTDADTAVVTFLRDLPAGVCVEFHSA